MKILLGVTGSISAYKSIDLARLLINSGHQVKVVLSQGALKFVVPEVFGYLGAESVHLDEDDFKNKGVLHIELARWSDKLIIAPLSANTLSRFVNAEASDLLSSIFLAYEKTKPILVFPAMNTEMLTHPFVEENFEKIKKLKSLNNIFVSGTNSGILACNDEGAGKLPTIFEIKELIETISLKNSAQKKFVITTGATIAPLDPVRFLTNSSSGVTGFHLAHTYLSLGHQVNVIAGINSTDKLELLLKHPNFKLVRTKTVDDMFQAVHQDITNADYYLGSAAISDIEFDYIDGKIKKDQLNDSLKIKPAKDILKSIIELQLPHLKIIGFAAETDLSDEVLNKKFQSKPVDLLVGTKVHNGTNGKSIEGFNNDNAFYRFKNKDKIVFEGNIAKSDLGNKILGNL